MSLVSKHYAGLYNGISQQVPALRLASQAELQENAYSSLVYGLHKRPPLQHVKNWSGFTLSDTTFFHKIDRDSSEKYIVTKGVSSGLRVHDLEGNEYPVVISGSASTYLTTGSPRSDLRMVTLADYTLIVNRKVPVGMTTASDPTASLTKYAYIYVKKGVAEQTYYVSIDGQTFSHTTGVSTDADSYHTTVIAQALYSVIAANSSYTASLTGSTIRVKRVDGADFSFKCWDTWGDAAIKGFKGTIQSFKDLPQLCFQDTRVKVINESTNGLGSFWVNYSFTDTDQDSTKTSGQWIESREPGISHAFDTATMPHQMVRKQSATYITTTNPLGIYFDVGPAEWEPRKVGDELTAPSPSFVGETISDIFLFRNRLGVISKQSLTLSRAGQFFDFFPSTVMDILDDDPINVEAPAMDASVLTHALPINEHLMIFSEKQKFIATSGDQTLSNQTISVTPVMTIPSDPYTVPVRAGQMVFFLSPHGSFQGVREYFVQPEYISNEAPDITSHVPQFIPNFGVTAVMETIPNHELLFITSPDEQTALYVYKYSWAGNEKVQSSWSKWVTSGVNILSILSFDNRLYVMTSTGIAKWDFTYDPDVVCRDLGTNEYMMKYRFSPVYIRTAENTPGEIEGELAYRKLALSVTGKSNINVNVISSTGGIPLQYLMDTSTAGDSELSIQEFFLRGYNTNTLIELTDSSEHLTTIQSASFEMFAHKRSTTMP